MMPISRIVHFLNKNQQDTAKSAWEGDRTGEQILYWEFNTSKRLERFIDLQQRQQQRKNLPKRPSS